MKKYSFEDLKAIVAARLKAITYQRESFTMEAKEFHKDQGIIDVFYRKNQIFSILYTVTTRCEGGKIIIGTSFYLKAVTVPEFYKSISPTEQINEWLEEIYMGKNNHNMKKRCLNDILDFHLPLKSDLDVEKIKVVLKNNGVEDLNCIIEFDTYLKKYILKLDLKKILNISSESIEDENEQISLYKYMSLDAYYSMLQNGKFRMNSIVSMNDITEAVWMDILFYGEEKLSVERKYQLVLENRNVLISSFSDKKDDYIMWKLYGNHGRGVCLGFKINRSAITKINYIDKSNKSYLTLRKIVSELFAKNIQIAYLCPHNLKYYVKNTIYNIESEYRIIWDKETYLKDVAMYNNLLSPYKDFEYNKSNKTFNDLGLKFDQLIIGYDIPFYESNYPLLIDLTEERFGDLCIRASDIKNVR